jgi:RNA polymerase sigma factor (sigma-70 family)
MDDDLRLLRAYVEENSEESFATLVSRYIGLVHSVALRRVGDAHLAEDVTQAVFILLARKGASFGPKTILAAWLYRAAQFASRDALKRQRRWERRNQEAYMESLSETQSPEPADWVQIAPLLDTAMGRLRKADSNAILLRFFEGKSFQEVAAALGTSENAAKVRVSRAVERLRRDFRSSGVSLSAGAIAVAISTGSVQAAPAGLAGAATASALGGKAAASTLAIVDGAARLLAWAKVKTAGMWAAAGVAVALGSAHVVVSSRVVPVQPRGEFRGTLTVAYVATSNTVQYAVRLRSEPPYWELSLDNTNEHLQAFGSPEQTVLATLYPQVAPGGGLNTATVKVWPGGRPLDARAEEHVWLALLSGGSFAGKRAPAPDPGLCMAEPVVITRLDSPRRGASPRALAWHNARADRAGGARSYMSGQFEWLAETNLADGVRIPLESKLSISITNVGVVTESTLRISEVGPLTEPLRKGPAAPGRWLVFDARLNDAANPWKHAPARYDFAGQGIPAKDSPVAQVAYRAVATFRTAVAAREGGRASAVRVAFWGTALLSGLVFLGLTVRRRKPSYKPKEIK